MTIELKLVALKASSPILVKPSGRVIEVSFEHPRKALYPISKMSSGITVFWHPTISLLDDVSIMALQLFLESYLLLSWLTIMDDSGVSENAPA